MAYAGKNFGGGGFQGRVSGLVGGPGGGSPRTPENFENWKKIPEENCKKCCIFAYFAKNSKPGVKVSRVWTKNTIVRGNFEKILKRFDENSMEKIEFLSIVRKICC